jgi:hypothetical protein
MYGLVNDSITGNVAENASSGVSVARLIERHGIRRKYSEYTQELDKN